MASDTTKNSHHVCPWWLGYAIDNPLRRLFHDPEKLLAPYLRAGMSALDIGCGMGMFSLGMAKLVGPNGKVVAADLQQKMLEEMAKRSRADGLSERIHPHLCASDRLGVAGPFDFALAFYVLHEAPHPRLLMEEVFGQLTSKGRWLVAEPKVHVSAAQFEELRSLAGRVGFVEVGRPDVCFSYAVLLEKPEELVLE